MSDGDPRLHEQYVRRVPGTDGCGAAVLAGVVHDHPASVHRVRSLARAVDPDVLALELAPLSLPLFEQHAERTRERGEADDPDAAGERAPPERGGEMSAAIRAAETDRVVAIDGPSLGFLRTAAAHLGRADGSRGSLAGLVGQFARVGSRALACRVAAALDRDVGLDPASALATEHDVTVADPPGEQAIDERRQVRRATAIASALQRPDDAAFRDAVREAHMARRLRSLREEGDVLAVVGVGHLDAVRERLAGPASDD